MYCLVHTLFIFFQPLDMALFHPLKAHFYRLAQNIKLVKYRWKEPITCCKINFTKLFKEPWESMTVMLIKTVFWKYGIFLLRRGATDTTFQQFIKSTSNIIKYIKSKSTFFNYCTKASTQVPQPQGIAVSLNPLILSGTVPPTIRH